MRIYIFIYVVCCVSIACESSPTNTLDTSMMDMMLSNSVIQDLNPLSSGSDAFTSSPDKG